MFDALSGYIYNYKICFVGIEPKCIVCYPARAITGQSPSCLRERSVSAVDKEVYTWVSSVYKSWFNLWL